MTEPLEVLEVDKRVALWAARWPSSRVEGVAYDVALHSGEPQGWCAVCEGADPWISDLPNGGCVCERRPPFWSCTCPAFTFRDRCRHVVEAIAYLAREEKREERQAKLDARLGCRHPLTVDDEEWDESAVWRRCLGCGHAYDRLPHIVALHEAIRARHRLPSSPWTGAERAGDTE